MSGPLVHYSSFLRRTVVPQTIYHQKQIIVQTSLTPEDQARLELIKELKSKHGEVFEIDVDGHKAYLKKPDRKTLSYASSVASKDPIKFNEILLNGCWLAGDDRIKTDDSLFLSASQVLGTLVEVKEASLVKL